jgi:hypothetical protein
MPTLKKQRGQPAHSAPDQPQPPAGVLEGLTLEEHLRVQREINGRAYRFWLAKGRGWQCALADWLKAENEVLAEFVTSQMQNQVSRPASRERQPWPEEHQPDGRKSDGRLALQTR